MYHVWVSLSLSLLHATSTRGKCAYRCVISSVCIRTHSVRSYVSETRILRNTICSLNLPGWGVGGGAGKSVEGEETPDLFNLYINFLSVTSFVAFFFFFKKKKRRRRRRRRSRRRSMAIKIFCVPTSHLISHVLSDFSSSSPISPQYRSNTINITVRLLEGSLQFVVYCKVEMWRKASIVGEGRERVREGGGSQKEVQKTREEKLTFYDLHNLRTARYKAYLSVLEVEEVQRRMYL